VTFAVGMGALILGNLTLLLSGTYPLAVFGSLLFLGVHWAVIQVRAGGSNHNVVLAATTKYQ